MKPGMFGDKVPVQQTSDSCAILIGQHSAKIAGILEEQASNCEVEFAAIHMLSIL
jgi:hypothetical protein